MFMVLRREGEREKGCERIIVKVLKREGRGGGVNGRLED